MEEQIYLSYDGHYNIKPFIFPNNDRYNIKPFYLSEQWSLQEQIYLSNKSSYSVKGQICLSSHPFILQGQIYLSITSVYLMCANLSIYHTLFPWFLELYLTVSLFSPNLVTIYFIIKRCLQKPGLANFLLIISSIEHTNRHTLQLFFS